MIRVGLVSLRTICRKTRSLFLVRGRWIRPGPWWVLQVIETISREAKLQSSMSTRMMRWMMIKIWRKIVFLGEVVKAQILQMIKIKCALARREITLAQGYMEGASSRVRISYKGRVSRWSMERIYQPITWAQEVHLHRSMEVPWVLRINYCNKSIEHRKRSTILSCPRLTQTEEHSS